MSQLIYLSMKKQGENASNPFFFIGNNNFQSFINTREGTDEATPYQEKERKKMCKSIIPTTKETKKKNKEKPLNYEVKPTKGEDLSTPCLAK